MPYELHTNNEKTNGRRQTLAIFRLLGEVSTLIADTEDSLKVEGNAAKEDQVSSLNDAIAKLREAVSIRQGL